MRGKARTIISSVVFAVLNSASAMVRTFAAGWRVWGSLAIVGTVMCAAYAWSQPEQYRSEGTLTLTPRYLLEGYLLATQELAEHYAARLVSEERIARAMRVAESEVEPAVTSEGQPGMQIGFSVEHPDAAVAERIARALMVDLRDEIFRENQARMESDRLDVALTLTSFARPTAQHGWLLAFAGTAAGFMSGVLLVLIRGWWHRDRVRTDREARRILDVPLLGMIPKR